MVGAGFFAFAIALLLPQSAAARLSSSPSTACKVYGSYECSEDVSIYKDGLLFVTTGLVASDTQQGGMLMVDLAGNEPVLSQIKITGMPASFGFRPHGMFLDNTTKRIFAVSHDDKSEQESIAVFRILHDAGARLPTLEFMYTLISDKLPYYGHDVYWYLNDVVMARLADGTEEVYATQFGPHGKAGEFSLYRCVYDESAPLADGRLAADCAPVQGDGLQSPSGYNGVTINGLGDTLWVNQLWEKKLLTFRRDPDSGAITRDYGADIMLPNVVDNIEYDAMTGDLMIGDIGTLQFEPEFAYHKNGGLLLAKQANDYQVEPGFREQKTEESSNTIVSAAVLYGQWVVVGSPFDKGLLICHEVPMDDDEL